MLPVAPWSEVNARLPSRGRALLANFDDETVTVFTAHGAQIAEHALREGAFGGDSWRAGRMTRFRLCFGDLYHHTAGGTVPGKEHLLAVTLRRDKFDALLRQVIHWREFPVGIFETKGQWRLATRYAQAVMDWRTERTPTGRELGRSCVRFGVRDHLQKSFNSDWIVGISAVEKLVEGWRSGGDPNAPIVRPYPVPAGCRATLSWDPEEHDVS